MYFSYRLGNALIDLSEFEEARSHLEKASDLYKEMDDHTSLADCYYSLSLTYRGDANLDKALNLVRSATVLWDALGRDSAYIKGLSRTAILLFSKEEYFAAIEMNIRIINFIESMDLENIEENYGWSILRTVDCYMMIQDWDSALKWLDYAPIFGNESKHEGNNWFYSLKARTLYQLDRHEEAMGVADAALAQTKNDDANSNTAYLYEIKAKVSLEQNRPDKERHLAHAISLHLAFGETEKARELSTYFKPDFTPAQVTGILNQEAEKLSTVEETPSFGFSPPKN